MRPTTGYRIRTGTELAPNWSPALAGITLAAAAEGATILAGRLDQPAPHGVLATIRDLDLPLISVEPVEPQNPPRLSGGRPARSEEA